MSFLTGSESAYLCPPQPSTTNGHACSPWSSVDLIKQLRHPLSQIACALQPSTTCMLKYMLSHLTCLQTLEYRVRELEGKLRDAEAKAREAEAALAAEQRRAAQLVSSREQNDLGGKKNTIKL